MNATGRPPRDRPVLYVANLDDPVLAEADYHHAARVLRLRDGAPVTVADGAGCWRSARLGPRPEPDGEVAVEPGDREVTIGVALIKALAVAVQKLTEVGVAEIVLLHAERNVVRWADAEVDRKLERLRGIVREAGTQSRRARLPVVHRPTPVSEVARWPGVVLAEPGSLPLEPSSASGVLIGPEGGWTVEEREASVTAALGPHVLRAETAAIVAAVLLVSATWS